MLIHPQVIDAAVFGSRTRSSARRSRPSSSQRRWRRTKGAPPKLEAELIAHCRARLANLWCPRSIDFRAELPRHDTAKLYERLLRDGYAAQAAG